MRILFIGDIMGKPGRWVVSQVLRDFKREKEIDFTIANVENAAGGFGVTPEISRKIFSYGVDLQTSGNHIWDRQEVRAYIDETPELLRPANYPSGSPGAGSYIIQLEGLPPVGVLNLQGRVYMKAIDCPFRTADGELSAMRSETSIIFVDIHAETTSEKQALAYYLDGRVSAVVGTHTHIQTADEKVSAQGTASINDAGMTGAHDSIIGMKHSAAVKRFLTGMPYRFTCAENDVRMQGVIVDVDSDSGRATNIERYTIKPPTDYSVKINK